MGTGTREEVDEGYLTVGSTVGGYLSVGFTARSRQEVGHGKLLELQLAKAVMAEKSGTATPAVRRPSRLTQAARQRCPEP